MGLEEEVSVSNSVSGAQNWTKTGTAAAAGAFGGWVMGMKANGEL